MSEFTCARCGKTFTHLVPGRDPMTEAVARFGERITQVDVVSVCTACDQAMRAWLQTPLGQQALAEWKAESQ